MSATKLDIERLVFEEHAVPSSSSESLIKLAVPIEFEYEWDWLTAFDFAAGQITVIALTHRGSKPSQSHWGRRQADIQTLKRQYNAIPSDFSDILSTLETEQPDACLILGNGLMAKLVTLAADLLGIAVFSLITTPDELENMPKRQKPRPDLFFLADSELFAAALTDPRYGSTVLPAGHPERDLILRGESYADLAFNDPRYGDGNAAARILTGIRRWREGALETLPPVLSIIVPAYRESGNVALVCERLLHMLETMSLAAEIIIVDDASPDDTYAHAIQQMWRSPRVRAFTKGTPRGMGNAIIHGFRISRGAYIAITMGDGSDEVDRIPDMLAKVRDEGYSLAIGSRYRHRANYRNVPLIYRFWSACFRMTTRTLIGFRLADYTNAFRVFNRDIFSRYGPESGGFEISPEITFKAWFATRRVTEVDVCHLKRASGQSTFSFLRAGPGYGKMLVKAIANRITGYWFTLDW